MKNYSILNLGCGTKTSDVDYVVNIDFSIYLIIKKYKLDKFLSFFLHKSRVDKLNNLPKNILVHNLKYGIPFKNNTQDVVYHSHILEHIDRDKIYKFFKETLRVLKPNGIQRIVVPNFEILCKNYIMNLEKIDKSITNDTTTHEDLIAEIIEQCVRKESHGTSKQNYLRRKIENLLLGDARQRGETHQWMYDRVTLSTILKEIGFKEIKIHKYDTSDIKNWNELALDINNDGSVYKKNSLYIECKK